MHWDKSMMTTDSQGDMCSGGHRTEIINRRYEGVRSRRIYGYGPRPRKIKAKKKITCKNPFLILLGAATRRRVTPWCQSLHTQITSYEFSRLLLFSSATHDLYL